MSGDISKNEYKIHKKLIGIGIEVLDAMAKILRIARIVCQFDIEIG